MKNIFLNFLLIIFLLLSFASKVSAVPNLGSPGFSNPAISSTSIAIDSNDIPYVVFKDEANDYKATVMKYNGSSWVTVGSPGFSDGEVNSTVITIDSNNVPYVVYRDDFNGSRATVMKYNGSSWVTVGSPGFSDGEVQDTYISLDSNNVPYVVYRDDFNDYKATVMKYNGSSWVTVGSPGFSGGEVNSTVIAIDSNNIPYVLFQDDSDIEQKATVMKYNGSSWVTVGSPGFSDEGSSFLSLYLDSNDVPYVAYKDTVMKYNGSSWVTVGSPGFSQGRGVAYTSLYLDSNDTPYVAFQENRYKASLMTYNGTAWVSVGPLGFSDEGVGSISLAIDSNDIPYVAYIDNYNDGRISVKYFPLSEPVVVTNLPTHTKTTAILYGEVTDSGRLNITERGFQYGLTESYGTTITQTGSYDQGVFSASITGLTNNTTYHYRSYAVNSLGTSYGDDITFTTSYNGYWTTLGTDGFTGDGVGSPIIEIDSNGIPYVAFEDGSRSGGTTVMKWNGVVWELVGIPEFNGNSIYGIDFKLNSEDVPYVAYQDSSNNYKISVMKYNGSVWELVGSVGFSEGLAYNPSLYFDSNNVPYVAYQDSINGGATVMKWNGSSWELLGSAGFSNEDIQGISLVLDSNDIPYVGYRENDAGFNYKSTVMKYNGATWELVGTQAFSDGVVNNVVLSLDSSDNIYIAYVDESTDLSNQITVMKWSGDSWELVGPKGFTEYPVVNISFELDSNDMPYVAYYDANNTVNGDKASSMRYNGTTWEIVGSAGFSEGTSEQTSIAFNSSGVPYVTYRDGANTNSITVKYFIKSELTVATNNASSVTDATVNLNGNITDIAEINPTVRGFQYGLDTNYGNTVNETGTYSTGMYVLAVSSLTCNSTYHYRAYATNSERTSYGEDYTFSTSPCIVASMSSNPPGAVLIPVIPVAKKEIINNIDLGCVKNNLFSYLTGKACFFDKFVDLNKVKNSTEEVLITSKVNNNKCSSELILTQDLKAGARNGKYHSYTKAIVKEVKILQTHMNRLGFNSGKVDGVLGFITDRAIKRMQAYLGTKQDGLIGPITRDLINNSCNSTNSL